MRISDSVIRISISIMKIQDKPAHREAIVVSPERRLSVTHRSDSGWLSFPFWRIVRVTAGSAVYDCGEGRIPVRQNDFLLLAPGKRRIQVIEPFRIEYLPFVLQGESAIKPGSTMLTRFEGSTHDRQTLHAAFDDACRQLTQRNDIDRAILQIRIMLAIFRTAMPGAPNPIPDPFHDIATRLVLCPEDHVPVSEMARLAGLSVPHFSREFRRHYKMPPARYAIQARIEAACRLLERDGLTVKETAYSLNYSSPFAFSKQFKAERGYPPKSHHRETLMPKANAQAPP